MRPYKFFHSRSLVLITLIIAGESIFLLPFVLARVFRPTLLEFFDISNLELGLWFSVYGFVAMISYVLGGPLADRFEARKLMAWALWLTAAGGILMSFRPPGGILLLIYAFWGFTTICLFWAALIRATREWGSEAFQGRAFGWLEGGRGAVAALLASASFFLFARLENYRALILLGAVISILSGLMVWFVIPSAQVKRENAAFSESIRDIRHLLRLRNIWILMLIIICGYSGYKITDDYSLFAREVLAFSELKAAGIGTLALWLRALVAVIAGYLADWLIRKRVIAICFFLTFLAALLIGSRYLEEFSVLLLLNLALTAMGIYGVRALYFSVLGDAGVPGRLTGTAVGLVSFAGFTPEIFMGPWMGLLLDRSPGAEGHAHVFILLASFALLGVLASLLFRPSKIQ